MDITSSNIGKSASSYHAKLTKTSTGQTLSIAVITLIIFMCVIFVNKIHETAHRKLPRFWQTKLKRVVSEAVSKSNQAEVAQNPALAFHSAVEAQCYVEAGEMIVGDHLSTISNYDIGKLKLKISEQVKRETQRLEELVVNETSN